MKAETRKKISESIKKAWREGRKKPRKHSELTKKKLSRSISRKWEEGSYKSIEGINLSNAHKEKISSSVRVKWADDDYRESKTRASKNYWMKSSSRDKASKFAKDKWIDDDYREITLEAIRKATTRPEYRELQRKLGLSKSEITRSFLKELWDDPLLRYAASVRAKARVDDVIRHKLSENSKKMWKDPQKRPKLLAHLDAIKKTIEYKENQNRSMRDPEVRARITSAVREAMASPEVIDKLSKAAIRNWSKKEYRERMVLVRALGQTKPTNIELALESILNSLGICYYMHTFVGLHEFDFVIPSHNIIIEVQGDYWHRRPRKVSADKARLTYIRRYYKRFDIKYVWEHEFFCQRRVYDKVAYWLGISETKVDFNFRDLVINKLSYSEASEFLSVYHYLGSIGKGGFSYGVFHNDVLIACVHLSSITRKEIATSMSMNPKNVFELSRMAIRPSHQKKNLASWLLARVIPMIRSDTQSVTRLVAFSDMSYGHRGTVYLAAGWKQLGQTSPDYWYVDKDGYTMHKKTLYNRARKMSLTERQFAEQYGYRKVWGHGKIKFIRDIR